MISMVFLHFLSLLKDLQHKRKIVSGLVGCRYEFQIIRRSEFRFEHQFSGFDIVFFLFSLSLEFVPSSLWGYNFHGHHFAFIDGNYNTRIPWRKNLCRLKPSLINKSERCCRERISVLLLRGLISLCGVFKNRRLNDRFFVTVAFNVYECFNVTETVT